MRKVVIASSRGPQIGNACRNWAESNLPKGWELTDSLEQANVFISVLYDKLLTRAYIDGRTNCFNFHPGILPDYRGAGAYSWALINGERETGVTLHEINHNIDSGPIITIARTLISETDTAGSLFERCMELLFDLFRDSFVKLLAGNYQTQPNVGGRLYLRKELEGQKDLTHLVRAFTFPGKESAHYIDSQGRRWNLDYDAPHLASPSETS